MSSEGGEASPRDPRFSADSRPPPPPPRWPLGAQNQLPSLTHHRLRPPQGQAGQLGLVRADDQGPAAFLLESIRRGEGGHG